MAMNREQYLAFEDIVGPENISDDPVILDALAWRSGMMSPSQEFIPRYAAMILPGTRGMASSWWKKLLNYSFVAPIFLSLIHI